MQKKTKYITNLFGRTSGTPQEYLNLRDVGSIGFSYILNTHNGGKVLKGILDILDTRGIAFTGLVVEPKRNIIKKVEAEYPSLLKNKHLQLGEKEHIGLKWFPLIRKEDKFYNTDYDLFISFNSDCDQKYAHIAKNVNARMKVGMQDSKYVKYALVIKGENSEMLSESEFLKQVFKYTGNIESIKNEPER